MSDVSQRKYWAFISYSHRDKAWGDWLHRGLETYRVPKSLVGRTTERGETVPERVLPVFRDREELPTAVNLGEVITRALEQSRYLIVICSPNSARSQWVNQEILNFKKLGGENRVLAIIVGGEPNASEGKAGFTADQECFPDALKFLLGPDGNCSEIRTEPIAADAREHADGRSNALLKLLAGVLGLPYDDLRQREAARQRRRQRVLMATVSALALVFGTLAVIALVQKSRADKNAEEARHERAEAVAQKKIAEDHLSEALTQQGRNFLNQSRAAFSAARPTEAHRLATSALQGLSLADGGYRPFFPQDSLDQRAARLLEKTTRGSLCYQQSREPFDVFFTTFAHDADSRRFYGGQKHEVRAYALENNALLWKTEMAGDDMEWLAPTTDHQAVIAAGQKTLTLLDARTGKRLQTTSLDARNGRLLGGTMERVVFGFSPDRLQCFAVKDGKALQQKTLPAKLLAWRFTPDGRTLQTFDSSGTLGKVDLETLEHHPLGKVSSPHPELADFSPDGEFIAVTASDGKVMRFTTSDAKQQGTWQDTKKPLARTISLECCNQNEVYVCNEHGWLEKLDASGRTTLQHIPTHFMPLLSVDVPNDQVLMTCTDPANIRKTNVLQSTVNGSHTTFAPFGSSLETLLGAARCCHPTGLALFSDDFGKVRVRMLATGQVIKIDDLLGDDYLADIACSMDGLKLAILSSRGVLRQYRLDGNDEPLIMHLSQDPKARRKLLPANRLSFAADNTTIHALTEQGLVKIDMISGTQSVILPKEDVSLATMIAPGPVADQLYFGTSQKLLIYNLKTRTFQQSLSYPGIQHFTDARFDADFVYVSAHREGQGVLLVLRRADHSLVAEFDGHQGNASSVLPMADGRVALTGARDFAVWNVGSLRKQQHQVLQGEAASSGAYSPAPGGRLQMPDNHYAETVSEIDPLTGRVLRKFSHNNHGEPGPQFTHREFAGQHTKILALSELPDRLHLFQRSDFASLASFPIGSGVDDIVLPHEASWLAVLSEDGACCAYDFKGKIKWAIPAPTKKEDVPWRIDVSDDDSLISLQRSNSQSALLIEASTGKPQGELPVINGVRLGKQFWLGKTAAENLTAWRTSDRSKAWSGKNHGVNYLDCILVEAEKLVIAWDGSGVLHYLDLETEQNLFSDPRFPLQTMEIRSGMVGGPDDGTLILNHSLGESYWLRRFGHPPPAWFAQ